VIFTEVLVDNLRFYEKRQRNVLWSMAHKYGASLELVILMDFKLFRVRADFNLQLETQSGNWYLCSTFLFM
jgi:hypothetical protein